MSEHGTFVVFPASVAEVGDAGTTKYNNTPFITVKLSTGQYWTSTQWSITVLREGLQSMVKAFLADVSALPEALKRLRDSKVIIIFEQRAKLYEGKMWAAVQPCNRHRLLQPFYNWEGGDLKMPEKPNFEEEEYWRW